MLRAHPNPTHRASTNPTLPAISILEIIIHTRPLIPRHVLLPLIHLNHHATTRRLLRLLIIPNPHKPWKPQTDPPPTRIPQRRRARLVPRTQRQISRLDLPDEAGLEPDVRLVLGHGAVGVKGFRPIDGVLGEQGVQFLEDDLGEAGADVADGLVGLRRRVVAGQQEGAVDGGALALAEVGAEHDEVERVADAAEVVLFDLVLSEWGVSVAFVGTRVVWCGGVGGAYLEPVSTSLARLVAAFFRVEHFHHQAFAGGLDAFVEEDLDLFELAGVAGLGEGEFAFDFLEGVSHQLAPLSEGFLDDGLGVVS